MYHGRCNLGVSKDGRGTVAFWKVELVGTLLLPTYLNNYLDISKICQALGVFSFSTAHAPDVRPNYNPGYN